MSLSPGDKLGPYEILSPLGEGGMGEVYKARDTRLHREVALKTSKSEFSERFEREARSVAALNHPNICQLYDVGPNFLVMELIDGVPLKGPLPLDKAVEYSLQILDALDAAHRKGITHRDLKPANILLTKQGIKLLDFGLAKQTAPQKPTDATLTQALTGDGQILGTLQYMSPEQLSGEPSDARSDLFSFGCVLHELLTGSRAFDGKNAASIVANIMSGEPAPLPIAHQYPALARLLQTCFAKDPNDRWQTAADLRRELRWAANAAQPQTAAPPSAPMRQAWLAAALLGLALGATAVWFARQPNPEPPFRLSIVPPELGTITAFTISPDGQSIAFPELKDGKSRLWVRRLDSDTATPVPGTEGAGPTEAPAWSPDSQQLAFVASDMLKLVNLQSGTVRELVRARNRGLAWNKDDILLFVDFEQTINKVPAAGGKPEKLTLDLAGAAVARFPFFLPDQNRFFYLTRGNKGDGSIRLGSLDGKTNKSILASQGTAANLVVAPGGSPAWLVYARDGALLGHRFNLTSLELEGKPMELSNSVGNAVGGTGRAFFSAHSRLLAYRAPESSLYRLVWYDPSGKRLQEIGETQHRFGQLRLSPDGKQALVDRGRRRGDASFVESVDLATGAATRRTFGPDANDAFWSPDGKSIYFSTRKDERSFIHRSPADWSTPPELLHRFDSQRNVWDYHPSHQTLLLYDYLYKAHTLKSGADGWKLGRFPDPNENIWKAKFSPDGQWIAYQDSGSVEGQGGLYIKPFPPTGAKWQIATGGVEAVWRRDGKELYFLRGNEVMAVSISTADRTVKAGIPRPLFRVSLPPPTTPGHRYDVAPNGNFLVLERVPDPPGVPFTVLLNWQSLLPNQ